MNNTLEGISIRITDAEKWISYLENRMVKVTAAEQNIDKRIKKKNEDRLRDLWDNIKLNNIHFIGVPEGKEREKGPEKMFEKITAENIPNMTKEIVNQVQEMQSPKKDKPKEEHTETHSNQNDED